MKRNLKKAVLLLLVTTMVFGILSAGCGQKTENIPAANNQSSTATGSTSATPASTVKDHYTIGVVIHTTTDFLCSKLKAYMDYIGENLNVTFDFTIIENFSDDVYLGAIENLCAKQVDGIICTNFSGPAIMKGIEICEKNNVLMGVGFSQITNPELVDQAFANKFYSGSAYEQDYKAGYQLIESLIEKGCKNIAAIGYTPGITCHDRRWEGIMAAFKDHPEVRKVGEYRGTEFTPAVQNFLATDDKMDGIAITLLGMEFCHQPIAAAGKTGKVKIACVDFSDMSEEGLASGELVTTVGGQFVDSMFVFIQMYNRLLGTPLSDKPVEIPVNFITCKTAGEFRDYMKYVHGDVWPWTADELKKFIKKYNPDATIDLLKEAAANFSVEDVKTRHASMFK